MARSSPLLQVDNLSLGFQLEGGLKPLLKSICLAVLPGQTLALVGESGSGKSMTALAIMQLLPSIARAHVDSRIVFKQQELLGLSQRGMRKIRGRQIGMVFQNAMSAFNPVLTIGYQLHEVLSCHFALSRAAERERILELLDEVGIVNPLQCYRAYPHQLSGGMRQRALIAMALAAEPELLIADEPTTALDVTIQAQVLATLQSIQAKRRMSMLFISHDLGVVARMADTVAVLYHGEIVEQASASDFFHHPQEAYSKQLFASLPAMKANLPNPERCLSMETPLLTVDNLSVHFPLHTGFLGYGRDSVKAVDGVSFNLYSGKTLALIGESGSGKTTIGRAILQLIPSTSGQIYFTDQLLGDLNRRDLKNLRKDIQVIFQDPYAALNPRMTIASILEEGMLVQGIGKTAAERLRRMDDLLVAVGLNPDCKQRYPHEFSGGERQRICIARALTVEPKLLICDEPTSALDVSVQAQILKLLRQLQEERGLAYLLITHNFGVVSYLADEVAVMYRGQIVEHGTSQQILSAPQHPYTQKLLASVLTAEFSEKLIPKTTVASDEVVTD